MAKRIQSPKKEKYNEKGKIERKKEIINLKKNQKNKIKTKIVKLKSKQINK